MNRKQNRKWLFTTFLAVSSTTLFTGTAQAQHVAGSFTLPFTVHWGLATLPPGNYTFSARSTASPFILRVNGAGTSAMIRADGQNTLAGSHSSLLITREGNRATVSSLQLAPYGATFHYTSGRRPLRQEEALNRSAGNPKTVGASAAAQVAAAKIPITVGGH
ncbi:MAG: hypothetical protein WB676_25400 [Bryobacteraceae bacterium]